MAVLEEYFQKLSFCFSRCEIRQEFNCYCPVDGWVEEWTHEYIQIVMFARFAADYNTKKNELLVATENMKARVNKKYVSLADQFLSNWDSCD